MKKSILSVAILSFFSHSLYSAEKGKTFRTKASKELRKEALARASNQPSAINNTLIKEAQEAAQKNLTRLKITEADLEKNKLSEAELKKFRNNMRSTGTQRKIAGLECERTSLLKEVSLLKKNKDRKKAADALGSLQFELTSVGFELDKRKQEEEEENIKKMVASSKKILKQVSSACAGVLSPEVLDKMTISVVDADSSGNMEMVTTTLRDLEDQREGNTINNVAQDQAKATDVDDMMENIEAMAKTAQKIAKSLPPEALPIVDQLYQRMVAHGPEGTANAIAELFADRPTLTQKTGKVPNKKEKKK